MKIDLGNFKHRRLVLLIWVIIGFTIGTILVSCNTIPTLVIGSFDLLSGLIGLIYLIVTRENQNDYPFNGG